MLRRALFLALLPSLASAEYIPLAKDSTVAAVANEISGEAARRHVETFATHHRMRGSRGFHAATEHIASSMKRFGLEEVEILSFPADGKIYYGTQKSRPAWNAEFAELWELAADGSRVRRLASWDAAPITLAQDSGSGEATTTLVDVGAGTGDKDYAGKDVKGKLVLASGQAGAVALLAVDRFGAAGVISYAQNQRTAWWGDERLVRWGHMESFRATPAFGFMISPGEAKALRDRLAAGQTIHLDARVRATSEAGAYEIATGVIRGSDPAMRREEIVYSCHLDHPKPGANDNASGCAAILEVSRALSKAIADKTIERPKRSIRFVFPAEIEGTLTLLNARPDLTRNFKAAIHLDMVGGGPETKAIFHVTRGPASLPSFVHDVAAAVGRFVNEQSEEYASTQRAAIPFVAPEGGKEHLGARFVPLSLGSDHQVYGDSSFGIPAVYLNDWPDRFIHTNYDVPANIDPTKMKRSAFIAAMTGFILADLAADDAAEIAKLIEIASVERAAELMRQVRSEPAESANAIRFFLWHEARVAESIGRFAPIPAAAATEASAFAARLRALVSPQPLPAARRSGAVYRRNPELKGTMSAFGYDYFEDRVTAEKRAALKLLGHTGLRGSGGDYTYEALNLVDGVRTTSEIRDALSAIYGSVPLADVEAYLAALHDIGVLRVR